MLRRNKVKLKVRDFFKACPDALHYLLEQFHTFEPAYVRGGADAERETIFREGRQSAGLTLLEIAHMSKRELEHLREEELALNAQSEEDMADDG